MPVGHLGGSVYHDLSQGIHLGMGSVLGAEAVSDSFSFSNLLCSSLHMLSLSKLNK